MSIDPASRSRSTSSSSAPPRGDAPRATTARRPASDRARALRSLRDQPDAGHPRAVGARRGGSHRPAPAPRHVRQSPLAARRPDQPEVRIVVPGGPLGGDGRDAAPARHRSTSSPCRGPTLHQTLTHAVAEGEAPDVAVLDSVWVPSSQPPASSTRSRTLDEEWVAREHEVDFLAPLVPPTGTRADLRRLARSPTSPASGTAGASSSASASSRPDLGGAACAARALAARGMRASDRDARRLEGRRDDGVLPARLARLERCPGARPEG